MKQYTPAPFDEKNLSTDWIEELFDDNNCVQDARKAVGFFEGHALEVHWQDNRLTLILHATDSKQQDYAERLHRRLHELFADDYNAHIRFTSQRGLVETESTMLEAEFYFEVV